VSAERFILKAGDDHRSIWRRASHYAASLMPNGAVEIAVKLVRSTRSLEQNARMWAMLGDISTQVPWVVNGETVTMSSEDWKDVLTAGLRKELRVAKGIDGGMVFLGQRTSRMTVAQMTDLIEFMFAFGGPRGVVWTDPMTPPPPNEADYPERWAA
jgi:hypothetical protein